MATIIETELKEILGEFKQEFSHLNQRLDTIQRDLTDFKESQQKELTDLKVSQAEIRGDIANIKTELTLMREDVKDLKGRASAQIWALIITVIGATSAAVIKFGFFS
jgi:archaellum component FlaC